MSNWNHFKDGLPEIQNTKELDSQSEDVLVIDSFGQMYVAYLTYYPIAGYRTKEEWYWSERSTGCGCCNQYLKVIYWMPLPKPPIEVLTE